MGQLFAMDGKVFGFLSRTADLVLLNLLWILFSLPVVTLGASTTALYTVLLKMARNEESYIFSGFVRAFRANFKQSTVIWCGMAAAAVLLHFDFYYIGHVTFHGSKLLFMAFLLIAFLLAAGMSYVFPILAFFENSTKKAVKNALLMAAAYLPYTILILGVNACPLLILGAGNLVAAAYLDVAVGFALAGYVNAHLFRRIFDKVSGTAEK